MNKIDNWFLTPSQPWQYKGHNKQEYSNNK